MLEVGVRCENPFSMTWRSFRDKQVEDVSDFHCVTTWAGWTTIGSSAFRTLAELAIPSPEATHYCSRLRPLPAPIPYTTISPSHGR